MIAYEDLVVALHNWRLNQGMPTAAVSFLEQESSGSVDLELPVADPMTIVTTAAVDTDAAGFGDDEQSTEMYQPEAGYGSAEDHPAIEAAQPEHPVLEGYSMEEELPVQNSYGEEHSIEEQQSAEDGYAVEEEQPLYAEDDQTEYQPMADLAAPDQQDAQTNLDNSEPVQDLQTDEVSALLMSEEPAEEEAAGDEDEEEFESEPTAMGMGPKYLVPNEPEMD